MPNNVGDFMPFNSKSDILKHQNGLSDVVNDKGRYHLPITLAERFRNWARPGSCKAFRLASKLTSESCLGGR